MSDVNTKTLNVLALGKIDHLRELVSRLPNEVRVEYVDDADRALGLLRREPFDFVITSAADLLPLESAHFKDHAPAVFDGVTQGVCVVERAGELAWANPKFLTFPSELQERVCQCCVETLQGARRTAEAGSTSLRGRRFSLTTQANEYFEVNVTPVGSNTGELAQTVAVVWNTTEVRRLQEKIDAIDRAGRGLVSLDTEQFSQLNTAERLDLLERKILESVHDLLNFDNFAILLLDKKTNRLEMLLSCGMLPEAEQTEIFASPDSNGISGYVAARGRSYICPDVNHDPRYLSGVQGARSSLTIPLKLHDEVVGVANFESVQPAAFSEDDRQFAEIFGRYIALALHILELLVSERYTTTGQVGSDVMAEITAPINDILSEVERLTEDYIGIDDLRHRLRQVSDNAVRIRDSIRDVVQARPRLVGAHDAMGKGTDPLLSGKRILVADDEEVIRETIREVLEGHGCNVTCTEEGATAVTHLGTDAFDLVLSDIKMPGRTGYEVFAAAKNADPDLPVILMTGFGYDPNHSIVRARREGLTAVLFKPFKVDQLLQEIRTALQPADAPE